MKIDIFHNKIEKFSFDLEQHKKSLLMNNMLTVIKRSLNNLGPVSLLSEAKLAKNSMKHLETVEKHTTASLA